MSSDVTPFDLLNPKAYGDKSVAAERFAICLKCDRLTKAKTCKECGCFMVAKTKLREATCPLGKW